MKYMSFNILTEQIAISEEQIAISEEVEIEKDLGPIEEIADGQA